MVEQRLSQTKRNDSGPLSGLEEKVKLDRVTPNKELIQVLKNKETPNVKKKTLLFEEKMKVMPDCSSPRMSKVMTVKKGFINRTKHTPNKRPVKSVKVSKSVKNILTKKTTSEKKIKLLNLKLENDVIPEDNSQTPGKLEFRKLVGRSPGKSEQLKRKTAHARGEGVMKRKELDETAKKLNLRKIENFFSKTVSMGERKLTALGLPECSGTSVSGGGVSWTGERCTVRCEDTECADQSEGATQAGLMNHLGFLGSTACDWTEGGVAGQVLEDVIGSNAGDGGV